MQIFDVGVKVVRKMLTKRQEQFVQNIVKGMSQRQAYKNAYTCKKMSDNAIDREASVLMKHPKVSQRLKELGEKIMKDAEEGTIMTAQERMEYLTAIVMETEMETEVVVSQGIPQRIQKPADFNAKLKAIDIMNKMSGEYVTKVEGSLSYKLEDLL